MRTVAPGTRVSGGAGASLPVITVRDLLDDLAEVKDGPGRVGLTDLSARLRKLAPAWLLDVEDVTWVKPQNKPQLDPAELRKALDRREVS
jgi:hypothetical protein